VQEFGWQVARPCQKRDGRAKLLHLVLLNTSGLAQGAHAT